MDLQSANKLVQETIKEEQNIIKENSFNNQLIISSSLVFLFFIMSFLTSSFAVYDLISGHVEIREAFVVNCISSSIFLFYGCSVNLLSKIKNKAKNKTDFFIAFFTFTSVLLFLFIDNIIPKEILFSLYEYLFILFLSFLSFCFSLNSFFNIMNISEKKDDYIKNKKLKTKSQIEALLEDKHFIKELLEEKDKCQEIYEMFIEKEKNNIESLIENKYNKEMNVIIND